MKILLISPAMDIHNRTNKQLMMPQLALYILEGLTPPEHEVKIVEEEAEEVNLDEDCDLVGISCMTANAPRAYYFAKAYRRKGKPVVLGGVHPTILPDEALQHADSVVTGEAEGSWEQLLEDVQNGGLKSRYQNLKPDLNRYIPKDFSKIINKRLFNLVPIMTSRGCPYNCDFCSVTDLFGKKIRHKPIENIVRDIKNSGSKNFMFLDDNIMGHPKYAKELFRAIKPLNIQWVGQASISLVNRETEMMELAAESGCKGLFIGLESVSESEMQTLRKTINKRKDLEKALKKIRSLGILIHASMIFGFDNDTKNVFQETVDFLIRNKISTVSFNILTPYPGTKTYQELKNEGRLLTDNWQHYNHNTVVFQPKNMSPVELQQGKLQARANFYKLTSVFKRFWGNLFSPVIFLATNYGHMKQVKVERKKMKRLEKELFTEKNYAREID